MNYRVVYGETMPAWERIFPTRREAVAFVAKCLDMGDLVFSVAKVVEGEPPRSLMAAIAAEQTVGAVR